METKIICLKIENWHLWYKCILSASLMLAMMLLWHQLPANLGPWCSTASPQSVFPYFSHLSPMEPLPRQPLEVKNPLPCFCFRMQSNTAAPAWCSFLQNDEEIKLYFYPARSNRDRFVMFYLLWCKTKPSLACKVPRSFLLLFKMAIWLPLYK